MLWSLFDSTTIIVGVVVFLWVRWLMAEPPNLPPGPFRWPVIGALPTMMKYPMEKGYLGMMENAKKYGGME